MLLQLMLLLSHQIIGASNYGLFVNLLCVITFRMNLVLTVEYFMPHEIQEWHTVIDQIQCLQSSTFSVY